MVSKQFLLSVLGCFYIYAYFKALVKPVKMFVSRGPSVMPNLSFLNPVVCKQNFKPWFLILVCLPLSNHSLSNGIGSDIMTNPFWLWRLYHLNIQLSLYFVFQHQRSDGYQPVLLQRRGCPGNCESRKGFSMHFPAPLNASHQWRQMVAKCAIVI